MDTQVQLMTTLAPRSSEEIAGMRNVPYWEAVGTLMYVSLATWPGILFTVQMVLCIASNPGQLHWIAVKHIFCYLLGMWDLWLTYGGILCILFG